MGKGSNFERDICKQLSLWWTNQERDDVFWRTAGSGAMAKVRSKVQQQTFGQYGDIQATDPIGQPLIDLCSIELKRGYSKGSLMDMLDKKDHMKHQPMEEFILQAMGDAKNAGSPFWLVITRRDSRQSTLTMPLSFYRLLPKKPFMPICKMKIHLRPFKLKVDKWKDKKGKKHIHTEKIVLDNIKVIVVSLPLQNFLDNISSKVIKVLANGQRKKKTTV